MSTKFRLKSRIIFIGLCLAAMSGLAYFFIKKNNAQLTPAIIEALTWQFSQENFFSHSFYLLLTLALATSCGLPRQIAALVAGINLGALWGAIVATIAATLGCMLTLIVARYILSDKITQKYPKQLNKLSEFLKKQTFLKAIVIRLLPLGSNFLTNIIAGVSKVSMKSYVGGSFVGFIPQMAIFALAGSGIRLGEKNELLASALLFIIALALTAYLFKKHHVEN